MSVRKARTRVVAVEDGLRPVAEALRERGYEVMTFTEGNLDQAEALVVSGQDDNLLGVHTRQVRGPVISAEGKTPVEIVRRVEKELGGPEV
ncbi:MAG TPA: hypothetical protein DHW14_09070 [Clostridiales bacterium]|nr:hypothetical protein [Clostridiales bacterium]